MGLDSTWSSRANGALRIGINQWPDGANGGGPQSTAGAISADPQTGPGNWVFFAVAYDPSQASAQLKYYFGKGDQLAQIDTANDYKGGLDNGGLIELTGPLTVGNFGGVVGARTETGPGGGSRVFRGLMDELRIYRVALSLEEVRQAQLNGEPPPVAISITQQPGSQVVFAGQTATFRVRVNGSSPYRYQWERDRQPIAGATNETYTLTATLADSGASFRAVVGNLLGTLPSDPAKLTVMEENGHKIALSFSEGQGAATANQGNVGGSGTLNLNDNFPVFTDRVPAGAFAPPNNSWAIDFDVIAEGQGGRAIDFTNAYGGTIGPMKGFTLTGWLNCRDQQFGWGGNRILYCQTSPGVGGFDLVQHQDGTLWIGVNQWPDGSPNSPAKSVKGLSTDPAAGNANWVFFAFTYDGTAATGNANFYFGSPTEAAALDSTFDYDRGVINAVGRLTVGNFSGVDAGARNGTGNEGGSRVFRGLMDELNVYNKVLTLGEIQAAQKAPPGVGQVLSVPIGVAREGNQLALTWESPANFQLQYRTALDQGGWLDETTAPTLNGNRKTVSLPATGSARFYRLISR